MKTKGIRVDIGGMVYVPNPAFKGRYLNSKEVINLIEGKRQRVQQKAHLLSTRTARYSGDTQPGRVRCHGIVHTANMRSMFEEKNNVLLKALRSVGKS